MNKDQGHSEAYLKAKALLEEGFELAKDAKDQAAEGERIVLEALVGMKAHLKLVN